MNDIKDVMERAARAAEAQGQPRMAAALRGLATFRPEALERLDGILKDDEAPENPGGPKPIPVIAAERIAKQYNYDQVVIYARRVGEDPAPHGEHMTTYGRTRAHCDAAAKIGVALRRFMGWDQKEEN